MRRRAIAAAVWFTLSAVSAATTSAGAQGGAPATGAANREALEQSVRQRFGEVVRRRLALSDEQMQKLQATNRKFESRRVELVRRERAQRIDLRAQMAAGDSANQSRVAELLDGVLASERERLDITAAEQKELATFLTPLQRARYLELQNQLRRRVDDMRRQRELRQRGDSSLPPPRRAPALRP